MKKCAIIIVILLFSLPLSGCERFFGVKTSISFEYGNTASNIANGGLALTRDDWLYYVNPDDNNTIYKSRHDGSSNQKLNERNSAFLNIMGDWIYYIDHTNYILYKMSTDGKEELPLTYDAYSHATVVNDWVYYLSINDFMIYRVRTDGTDCTQVSEDRCFSFSIQGDWIYYINTDNYDLLIRNEWSGEYIDICKIRTDGSENHVIYKEMNINPIYPFSIIVDGDWVYYMKINKDSRGRVINYSLFKVNIDGAEKTEISWGLALSDERGASLALRNCFAVEEDWIYYLGERDAFSDPSRRYLYKMRTDGTEKEQLNTDTSSDINIVGNWIYYINPDHDGYSFGLYEDDDNDEGSFYRVAKDGTTGTRSRVNFSVSGEASEAY